MVANVMPWSQVFAETGVQTENGDVVVMACRSLEKCKAAAQKIPGERVNYVQCDLGSFKKLLRCTKEVKSKVSQINSLVLNAGMAQTVFGLSEDGIEKHMGEFIDKHTNEYVRFG